MSDDLFCIGNKYSIHRQDYGDNWTRTFRGYPKMNVKVRGMIGKWAKSGAFSSIFLFFCEKCGYDEDYSGFLMREAMAGNL